MSLKLALCFLLATSLNLSWGNSANRRPLDPPELIQFSPEDHFSPKYKVLFEHLAELVRQVDSHNLDEQLQPLSET